MKIKKIWTDFKEVVDNYYVEFHTTQWPNENIYRLIDVQCVPIVIVSSKTSLVKNVIGKQTNVWLFLVSVQLFTLHMRPCCSSLYNRVRIVIYVRLGPSNNPVKHVQRVTRHPVSLYTHDILSAPPTLPLIMIVIQSGRLLMIHALILKCHRLTFLLQQRNSFTHAGSWIG